MKTGNNLDVDFGQNKIVFNFDPGLSRAKRLNYSSFLF